MRTDQQGRIYPPYTLRLDREKARDLVSALGVPDDGSVPLTYLIFLRGENLGVNLFADLDIPREKALHAGQRYEWFAPLSFDDEVSVTATIDTVTEKQGKRGPIWFADVSFEYRKTPDDSLVLREITRLVKQS
jgi:hypothetical protein